MASSEARQLANLTGARQTMLSWSKIVESCEAMPVVYRDSFGAVLAEDPRFPYTVLAPSIPGGRRNTTEKLICEAGDAVYVWERLGDRVALTAYPFKTISDLEVGRILLYSWITIGGVTQTGTVSSSTIEFNTVTDRYYAPFLKKMRPAPSDADEDEQNAQQARFDFLAYDSYKFMNYGRESLLSGEKVVRTIWQPKISKPIIRIGGRVLYESTLSLTHLAILTDRELIVILDDERSSESRGVRYGGKWQYLALSHISGVARREEADGLVILSLTLCPGGRQREIVFAAAQEPAVARLQDELERRCPVQ